MSTINGYDSNSISTLFSSLSTSSSSSSSSTDGILGINLADYASIKNGSYSKLLNAYYAVDDEETKTNSKNDTDDTDQTLKSIKSSTEDLKESAQALYGSKSLFTADANGEYDMEAIYEKVSAFIEDYNSTVESVGSAETESIAKAGANMVNATNEYADMLGKLGITISKSDYTLSIDKEAFLSSSISDVKSMFSGVGSFAYQVGAKASRINSTVADKVSASGYYSSSAGVNASTSSTSKDTASTIAKIKDNANNLNAVGIDLYKNRTLFNAINGEYDTEEIADEIGAFIEAYNDLIISAENSKASGITSAVKAMTGISEDYAKKLSAIGITVDDDNTLVFDEDTFKNSKMSSVESLFTGTGSYAYQISVKAAMVATQAETEANKSNTYTEDGTYSNNYNTGSILDGIV